MTNEETTHQMLKVLRDNPGRENAKTVTQIRNLVFLNTGNRGYVESSIGRRIMAQLAETGTVQHKRGVNTRSAIVYWVD